MLNKAKPAPMMVARRELPQMNVGLSTVTACLILAAFPWEHIFWN